MKKLEKLENLPEIFKDLDLTNSILVQISMFLNDSDKNCYIDKKDQKVLRKSSDTKLVNDLMNVLLSEEVASNKSLHEELNKILQKISDNHELKKNLFEVFKNKENEIFDEKNRWDDLKESRNRDISNKDEVKFKAEEGFIPIYKKPGGYFFGNLNFKAINSPSSKKESEKYLENWANSKYFNIWMRKYATTEAYITKLVDLFYGGRENFYKLRRSSDTQIFIKFVPNVQSYNEYANSYLNPARKGIFSYLYLNSERRSIFTYLFHDYIKSQNKIDQRSILKFLIVNFLIQNRDPNGENILIKKQNEKNNIIPIDFGMALMLYNDQDILDFAKAIKNQDFFNAKDILIEKYASSVLKPKGIRYIDFKFEISNISDAEFQGILNEMFSEYEGMKKVIDEYRDGRNYLMRDLENNLEAIKNAIESLNEKNQDKQGAQETKLIFEKTQDVSFPNNSGKSQN